MLSKIVKVPGQFTKSVMILMSGSLLAQALPIALSPILTRLYSPSEFGTYGLYLAIVAVLSSVATGRYELSIMLPEADKDASNLVVLSTLVSLSLSLFSLIIILCFHSELVNLLGNNNISSWLYFIPISILSAGLFQTLKYWNIRLKSFKQLAGVNVVKSACTSSSNLTMGVVGFQGGLIVSNIFGTLIACFVFIRGVLSNEKFVKKDITLERMLRLGKEYIKFPKFDVPSALIYSIYSNMNLVFFNKFFESATAGYYFFANRLLKLPFSFFISSFSDVFYQHLAQEVSRNKLAKEVNKFSIKILFYILLPFLAIVYSSKYYVGFIFGEEWRDLYKYLYIFSLPILIGLCLSPYGHILKIINRQDVSLKSHFAKLITLCFFFGSYFYIDYDLLVFVYCFSVLDSFLHISLAFCVDYTIKNVKIISMTLLRLTLWATISLANYWLLF